MRKCGFVCVLILSVFSLVLFSGCGERHPAGMPKLYSVKLTATFEDGKPADHAQIILIADQGGNWSFTANTDDTGSAAPVTQGMYRGIPAGKYKITISRQISEGEPSPGDPFDNESAKKYQAWLKSKNKLKTYQTIAPEYEDQEKTPLEIQVDSKNRFFEIKVGKEVKVFLPEPKY